MPDAVEVAIESALLNQLMALTFSPAISVSLPNVGTAPSRTFTPPAAESGANWIRATFLPADSFALSVDYGGSNQHYGILQVDCFGYQGDGELSVGRIAASVIAWFKRGTKLTKDGFTVEIGIGNKIPYRKTTIKDDPWVFVPVCIPYRSFAVNPA
jgi:hypothetical protein